MATSTLFGWPRRQISACESGRLCIMGAPSDRGNSIARGTADGPEVIRRVSLGLDPPAVSGFDWGDIETHAATDQASFMSRVADTIELIDQTKLCPLLLGGDHSITFAPVSTLQRSRDICLVWFDAHTDFSPWAGQGSHNHKQVLRRISGLEGVRRIVQIGYRGITTGDERQLGSKAVVVTTARARVLSPRMLLGLIPANLPCYISIDIDAVDPLWAPGTSARVPDGLRPVELRAMLRTIVRNRNVAGVDLVEVNPKLDVQEATSVMAAGLIREIADYWTSQLSFDRVARNRVADATFCQHDESPPVDRA